MTDQNNKLTPVNTTPNASRDTGIAANKKVSLPGLHSRLRNPKVQAESDPNTKPNRLALLLDCSGSMSGSKIQSLRDACSAFVTACSFADTSLAIEPFGEEHAGANRLALTCFQPILLTTVMSLQDCGSTPMAQAMDYVLNTYSLTRCVLVSDGQPDSEAAAYACADLYKEAGLPCDCVHIGANADGEACLRSIAERTGGTFIKFTDINSFARNFKYLTPAYYAQLTSGAVGAAQLGAREVK